MERSGREGAIVEVGVALGGSGIALAVAKSPDRSMKAYDVFGMIPPPSAQDGPDVLRRYAEIRSGRSRGLGGDTYYGYRDNLLCEVKDNFDAFAVPINSNNVELIQGLYKHTMHVDFPVALAHIDCDWYESVKLSVESIGQRLVPGGRMIIDDYYEWSGCRQAVDEFIAGQDDFAVETRARLHLVRRASP